MDVSVDLICGFDECGIKKGVNPTDQDDWVMFGWASTPARDAEDEQIIQKGLNLSPMLSHGWVNWDHDRKELIGWPTVGEFRPHPKTGAPGLYVEYKLIKGLPTARKVYELAKAIEEGGVPRQLGLSIEGQRRKVGNRGEVLQADVYGFAVTPYAVNNETLTGRLVKSISGQEQIDGSIFLPKNGSATIDELAAKLVSSIEKALSSGHGIGGTSQVGGEALRKESVDSTVQYLDIGSSSLMREKISRLSSDYKDAIEKITKGRTKVSQVEAAMILTILGYPVLSSLEQVGL